MSRFVTNETIKIPFDNEEWVEIKKELSYKDLEPFVTMQQKGGGEQTKHMIGLLVAAIKSWNFKDENGADVPASKENIEKLNIATITELVEKITTQYFPEKKD